MSTRQRVLLQACVHGLTTVPAAQAVAGGPSTASVYKVFQALVAARLLRRHRRHGGAFYTPTLKAARRAGLAEHTRLGMNEGLLARRFAHLCVTVLDGCARRALPPWELRRFAPELAAAPGIDNRFLFLERAGETTRLGVTHTDLGVSVQAVLRRVRRDLARRREQPAWSAIVDDASAFVPLVVTISQGKASALRVAFASADEAVSAGVLVLPALAQFTGARQP